MSCVSFKVPVGWPFLCCVVTVTFLPEVGSWLVTKEIGHSVFKTPSCYIILLSAGLCVCVCGDASAYLLFLWALTTCRPLPATTEPAVTCLPSHIDDFDKRSVDPVTLASSSRLNFSLLMLQFKPPGCQTACGFSHSFYNIFIKTTLLTFPSFLFMTHIPTCDHKFRASWISTLLRIRNNFHSCAGWKETNYMYTIYFIK